MSTDGTVCYVPSYMNDHDIHCC